MFARISRYVVHTLRSNTLALYVNNRYRQCFQSCSVHYVHSKRSDAFSAPHVPPYWPLSEIFPPPSGVSSWVTHHSIRRPLLPTRQLCNPVLHIGVYALNTQRIVPTFCHPSHCVKQIINRFQSLIELIPLIVRWHIKWFLCNRSKYLTYLLMSCSERKLIGTDARGIPVDWILLLPHRIQLLFDKLYTKYTRAHPKMDNRFYCEFVHTVLHHAN